MRRITRGTTLAAVMTAGTLTLLGGAGMAVAAGNGPTPQTPAASSSPAGQTGAGQTGAGQTGAGQTGAGQTGADAPTPGDVKDRAVDNPTAGDVKDPVVDTPGVGDVKDRAVHDREDADPARDRDQVQSGDQTSPDNGRERSDVRTSVGDQGAGRGDQSRNDAPRQHRDVTGEHRDMTRG